MASIGGISVFSIEGFVRPLVVATEVFERPGVNGHGGVSQGLRGESYSLTVVDDLTSNANRETQWSALRALGGTVVSVVDDNGDTYTGQLVQGVGQPEKRDCLIAVGGRNGGKYLLRVPMTLMAM